MHRPNDTYWSAIRGRFSRRAKCLLQETTQMNAAAPRASRLSEGEFRDRLEWGLQQGTPYWLWPATSIPHWQRALFEIERVTRDILSSGRCDVPLHGDAGDVGIAAYTSGMGPLLGYWISAGLLRAPRDTRRVLELHYRHNSVRMRRLAKRSSRAVAHLTDGGVNVTVLKGMHTAFACFPTPGTRPTSDIDLMIPPEDKPAADRILRELDYLPEHASKEPDEQFWRHASSSVFPQSLSYVHQDDPWGVDLHTSANRRYSRWSPIIHFDALIDGTAGESWSLCRTARTLSPVAAILFLACHAGCSFTNLRMLRLVELILAIRQNHAQPGWCWDEMIELGLRTGTLSSAYAALALADTLAPGTVPRHVLVSCKRTAPGGVVRMVAALSPATAHGIRRTSLRERYMWTSSLYGTIMQLLHDIFPADPPLGSWAMILKLRFWKLVHGRVSVSSSTS
jgi:hypothetical protein